MVNLECGLRPIGVYAYAPAGIRKAEWSTVLHGVGSEVGR